MSEPVAWMVAVLKFADGHGEIVDAWTGRLMATAARASDADLIAAAWNQRTTPVLSDEQIEKAALKATMARIYQVGGDPKLPIVPASKAWRREFYSAILAATKQGAEQGKADL